MMTQDTTTWAYLYRNSWFRSTLLNFCSRQPKNSKYQHHYASQQEHLSPCLFSFKGFLLNPKCWSAIKNSTGIPTYSIRSVWASHVSSFQLIRLPALTREEQLFTKLHSLPCVISLRKRNYWAQWTASPWKDSRAQRRRSLKRSTLANGNVMQFKFPIAG